MQYVEDFSSTIKEHASTKPCSPRPRKETSALWRRKLHHQADWLGKSDTMQYKMIPMPSGNVRATSLALQVQAFKHLCHLFFAFKK